MTSLVWDNPGKRSYEIGVDRGVFYPGGGVGVPWNGLIAVEEAPSGAEVVENYFDGRKFRARRGGESFAARIEAFTYPPEFEEYDGHINFRGQQSRKPFNLSYRVRTGNDITDDASYKIHLVYNATVSPASRNYESVARGSDVVRLEWDLTTKPEILPTGERSAHLIVDQSIAYPWAIEALEDMLYGTESAPPHFPDMLEVIELFEEASILRITDHGDGTFTAEGPDSVVTDLGGGRWKIEWPSVVQIDTHRYRVSSL